MTRSRFSEEQIIGVLKEQDSGDKVDEICRRHGISQATFYAWRKKYGGMEISDALRLKALEEENAKLQPLGQYCQRGWRDAHRQPRLRTWAPGWTERLRRVGGGGLVWVA